MRDDHVDVPKGQLFCLLNCAFFFNKIERFGWAPCPAIRRLEKHSAGIAPQQNSHLVHVSEVRVISIWGIQPTCLLLSDSKNQNTACLNGPVLLYCALFFEETCSI
jgi:hypothetical protein